MDILDLVGKDTPWLAVICLLISFIFEFSKIPVNPWGWLFHCISKKITAPIDEKLSVMEKDTIEQYKKINDCLMALSEKLENNANKEDDRYAKSLRRQIIDFGGSIRNGKDNSREAYEEVMRMYSEYHEILRQTGGTNGYIDTEYQLITESFKEHSKQNDFVE